MAEQYFNRDDRAAFKPMLQQYLREKAQRRGKITSDQALEGASEQFAKDRGYQELGGLVGALSTSASMAGTLGGKRSEASIIPTFMASQKDAAQTHYGNELALRDLEEKSLRTDMGIAQTIGGIDADDSKHKLDHRRVNLAENESLDSRTLAREKLAADLQDKLSQRKLDSDQLGETTRHNKAMEGLYGRGRGPAGAAARPQAWQIVPGQAEGGELYERNPYTGETRPVQLPKGFKPKDEITAERRQDAAANKPLTEAERNSSMFYNNAENALRVIEDMEAKGYRPKGSTALKGMAPQALQGYLLSDDEAKYQQAVRDFTAAKLRLESGAAIPQSEIEEQSKIYMARPGESDVVMQQKQAARRKALQGLEFKAGRGAEQIKAMPTPAPDPKNTQTPWMGDSAPAAKPAATGADAQALQWLQANPNDPAAPGVKAKLQKKGLL